MPPPPVPLPNPHLNLLSGTLDAALAYTEGSADWLLDISQKLFGPYAEGDLYVHNSESAEDWADAAFDPTEWSVVHPGDTFLNKIHEFRPSPSSSTIEIEPKLERTSSSQTSVASKSYANAFRAQCERRDARGVIVNDLPEGCDVSHLLPRRLDDLRIRNIVRRFCPEEDPSTYHKHDPRVGLLAGRGLIKDGITRFQLAFRTTANPNQYRLQSFHPGGPLFYDQQRIKVPVVHNHLITLESHDSVVPLPPSGIFDWHLLQSVFQKFGTSTLPRYEVAAVDVTAGDQDDEDDDADEEFCLPMDEAENLIREMFWAPRLEAERKQVVGAWLGGVLPSEE